MLETSSRYFVWLKKELSDWFAPYPQAQVFIFGSSLRRERFGDIDIGVKGDFDEARLPALRERLTESTFPYIVDIVNFNTAKKSFTDNVFLQPVVWIKHSS